MWEGRPAWGGYFAICVWVEAVFAQRGDGVCGGRRLSGSVAAVGVRMGFESVEREFDGLLDVQSPPVHRGLEGIQRPYAAGPPPPRRIRRLLPPTLPFPQILILIGEPLPQHVRSSDHPILTSEHLRGNTMLIRAVRVGAMEEQRAHDRRVSISRSEVKGGRPRRSNDRRRAVPVLVGVAAWEARGVDVCAVLEEETDDEVAAAG